MTIHPIYPLRIHQLCEDVPHRAIHLSAPLRITSIFCVVPGADADARQPPPQPHRAPARPGLRATAAWRGSAVSGRLQTGGSPTFPCDKEGIVNRQLHAE